MKNNSILVGTRCLAYQTYRDGLGLLWDPGRAPWGPEADHQRETYHLIVSANVGSSSLKILLNLSALPHDQTQETFDKSQTYGRDKAKFSLFSGLYKQVYTCLEPSGDYLSSRQVGFTSQNENDTFSDSSHDVKKEKENFIRDHAPALSSWITWRSNSGRETLSSSGTASYTTATTSSLSLSPSSSKPYTEMLADLTSLHGSFFLFLMIWYADACIWIDPPAPPWQPFRTRSNFCQTHARLTISTQPSLANAASKIRPSWDFIHVHPPHRLRHVREPTSQVSAIALYLGISAYASAIQAGDSIDTS
ncbi:hypothetical protein PUNSTDRAFT_143222 [Punctularia strigosozonata HHB-11173 SS5]|uniref:uncharacterized protein n=1 Tax=Punctularia strigosozonata (strain HHB-11173) TaxID=741275 RepID=UPI0004416EA2|nr:uncharacterized protein PUNSTDRAFT_143222 [Punctularia strigosozonata HHB-11173 SS5]EIN09790.1 hypothetical protein PUNSTDRAFT_143222 [Punctularia strigosozonata HHB-11173 SS5]